MLAGAVHDLRIDPAVAAETRGVGVENHPPVARGGDRNGIVGQ